MTDEQFASIAKLRAARRLWARVLAAERSPPARRRERQHAVTSRPMMSRYDPWVNMLRTTVAAFAAGVGGADSVTVLPFDSPLGRPDALGRRVARNTSHLLIDEAHVAHVADPAGGSYAVEKLTDDLARSAWEIFGRIEDGADLDEQIAETVARARGRRSRKRQRPITGLTEFPNLAEVAARAGAGRDSGRRSPYGASFEALRDDPAAGHGLPGHARHRRAAHRPRDLRHQPARRGRRAVDWPARPPMRRAVAAYDGQARRLPRRLGRGVRRVGRRGRGRSCAAPVRRTW